MTQDPTAIPSPPAWPLIGNLLQIPRAELTQYLLKTSRDFDGIFELNFLGRRVPFVYSAELVAELCDQSRFRKMVVPPLSFIKNITGNGLFTAESDDPQWEIAHRILIPAFSRSAIENYFYTIRDVAQTLLNKWSHLDSQTDIDIVDEMTRFALESIAGCGFGYSFHSFESKKQPLFLEALTRTLTRAMTRTMQLPYPRLFRRMNKKAARDIATLNNLVDDLIQQRLKNPTDSDDLLNRMLKGEDPKTGQKLDPLNIRYQIMTFLIAGHETTSGLFSFAFYYLMRNPKVLAQAYAEVDKILPNNTLLSFEHLSQFNVLDRILKESLRLWPTAPAMVVAPFENTHIGGRYPIARDQWTSVILPALHRDPKVWEDPDSFNIDRFHPENKAKIPPFAYLPFGNGKRACMGAQFALTEAKVALAMILQRFTLHDPYDYTLKIKETLGPKADRLKLRVRLR